MMQMIKATDPDNLLVEVNKSLGGGYDLYTQLFVSDEGLLCQRMVETLGLFEYCLVIAKDLDDLWNQERNAIDAGFDYLFNTVMWNGKYLQWMSRLSENGQLFKGAIATLADEQSLIPAAREDELQLVEGVRSVLHMAPASQDGFVVTIPFPLMFS